MLRFYHIKRKEDAEMMDLIERLLLCGFPEECAEEIVTQIEDDEGYFGAEQYVADVERNLYV